MTNVEPNNTPVVFCNEINIGLSDNDCQIRFQIQGVVGAQAHVAMTLKTAKLLYVVVQEVLNDFEKKTGLTIPLDENKLKDLRSKLASNHVNQKKGEISSTAPLPPS